MGDKPDIPQLRPLLKRSINKTSTKPNTNKHVNISNMSSTQPEPTSNAPKNTQKQPAPSDSTTSNQMEEYNTRKTFAGTTANFSFPKKDQAIIFNTIDGIPQIEYIKVFSTLTNPNAFALP